MPCRLLRLHAARRSCCRARGRRGCPALEAHGAVVVHVRWWQPRKGERTVAERTRVQREDGSGWQRRREYCSERATSVVQWQNTERTGALVLRIRVARGQQQPEQA